MNNLQQVQNAITEMIKSDYPNPIFTTRGHDVLIFQFDSESWNGTMEILDVPNEGIYLQGPYADIEENCETVELFMNEFKEIYLEEQRQLQIYVNEMY